MRTERGFAIWVILLVLCIGCATTFAQETTGGIEGTVKDSAGGLVPNITVIVTNPGFRRTITTNDEGFFRLLQVPPGTYVITTVAGAGFGESKYENVTVTIGKNTQLDIAVTPGGNVTTVDVAATDAPPVDTTSSAIQSTISAEKMALLPKGTGFTSLLKTVPGTRPESRTAGFSVDGASGGENVFTIDGQEVTNYKTGTLNETYNIPTSLVQEMQVKTSGFDAAYGGATGGVVSVVTKGGGNEFHGEGGMQFETPQFNGTPRPILAGRTADAGFATRTPEYFFPGKAGGVNEFPTFSIGGPILKDRVWFFTSYSPQIFNTTQDTKYYTDQPAATRTFITSETYRRQTKYEYAFGRVDANPFDNLRISSTFLWNPVIQQGSIPSDTFAANVSSSAFVLGNVSTINFGPGIGNLREPEYRPKQGGRQTSNLVTLAGVYTPTSNLVIDGRYSRGFLNEKLGNYFVPSFLRIAVCTNAPTSFECSTSTSSNSLTIKDVSVRETYEFSGAYIFNGGGRHELKGGYQRATIFNDVAAGNSGIGVVNFFYGQPISTTQPGVTDTAGAVGSGQFNRTGTFGTGSNLSQGIFIQDKYQPTNRLTLNLGIRIEKENLPTYNGIPSGVDFGWGDKIAPRLGFAYDLMGDGKTKIFASYGRFFDRVKFALPRSLLGGDFSRQDFFEIFPGDIAADFDITSIVGDFTGASVCPASGFIGSGLSRCQRNLRVAANEPGGGIFSTVGGIDPDLKPFRQSEFTVGAETQLGRDYVLRVRYTYKNVDEVVEDAGFVNVLGSEAYFLANPSKGLHAKFLEESGYLKMAKPQRRYDGLEVVLEKRLSDSFYFHANYTFSRLYGNYTGLVSSDESHLPFGRTDIAATRAFDLPFIGFTAEGEPDNGRLPTDRPHVFNIYGAYIYDWFKGKTNSTQIAAFQTIASGTPMTTTIYGQSNVTPQIFYGRGDLGRTPTFTQTDLNVTHRYRFGTDERFTMALDINFLNIWDQDTVTGIYQTMNTRTGRPNADAMFPAPIPSSQRPLLYANAYSSGALLQPILDRFNADPTNRLDQRYKLPLIYQSPRTVRFGFRFLF